MKALAWLWLGLFFLLPGLAQSQIVNIEDRRSQNRDTILWLGNLQLGFNLVENGKAVYTLNGGINAEYIHHRHVFLSFTRYNLVRAGEEDFVNDGFQHLRYNYELKPRLTWEIFAQAQYNERIKLRLRTLLGTGLRFSLLPIESEQRAYLGFSYMYEYNEENQEADGVPFISYFRDHRMSNYVSFWIKLGENTILANTSYYQPLLNNFADLRLSSQTSVQIGITRKLKFNTKFSIIYDSRVPDEVSNTIYNWSNGLRLDF